MMGEDRPGKASAADGKVNFLLSKVMNDMSVLSRAEPLGFYEGHIVSTFYNMISHLVLEGDPVAPRWFLPQPQARKTKTKH